MKPLNQAVAIGVSLALTLGACSSPTVRPDAPTDQPGTRAAAPSDGQSAEGTLDDAPPTKPPTVAEGRRWSEGERHYGIQVYAHTANGRPADVFAGPVLDYIVALGANGVGLTFPLYTDAVDSNSVEAGPETPPVDAIAALANAAHERGLRVMLRPVIDEANLMKEPGEWRGTLRPTSVNQWFRSYEETLRPYLKVAQASKVEEFVLAAELTSLQRHSSAWQALAQSASKTYDGTLSYTFNWDSVTKDAFPDQALGIDLYYALDLGDDASAEDVAAAMAAAIQSSPKSMRDRMVAQEVGIPAMKGMFRNPWYWGSAPRPSELDLSVQTRWFEGACTASIESGLDGIYFWMIDSSQDPKTIAPEDQAAAGFVSRPGEQAIKDCFTAQANAGPSD